MDCRKANIVLITIVSTLLIITCLVLIKFLFLARKILSGDRLVTGLVLLPISLWLGQPCMQHGTLRIGFKLK